MLLLPAFVLSLMFAATSAYADFTFGEAVNLGAPVNSPQDDGTALISPDGLEMYFMSNRPGGYGEYDIWVARRANVNEVWGTPANGGPQINSGSTENPGSISADGLRLYFSSTRPAGYGAFDLYTTTRPTREAPWVPAVNLGPIINSSTDDDLPVMSADGLELFFLSARSGGVGSYDVWVSMRASISEPWGQPVNLGPMVNSSSEEGMGCISPDGLTLFFNSKRSDGFGSFDVWMTTRPSKGAAWDSAANIGPSLNTSYCEWTDSMSYDGLSLYFDDSYGVRPGGYGGWDLWRAPIIPIVDFNGDGIVDINDLVVLIEHWGQDEPSVDIGPMPWGDGVVDAADLDVLMRYWQQEILPPDLIAYWKLDETEGGIAADSARDNDGTLSGEPLWRPEGGQVGGALQLDGVDDCVVTPFLLNPSAGRFSVYAWVKGGIPGQVVVSQIGGADWLCADPSQGRLMTGLGPRASRTVPPPLVSELVITDGNWHRIGFAWDWSHRRLYIDGVVVAEDAQNALAGSTDGLYIGCGKAMEAGTYWSGLIDDIRIYNRAVEP